MVFLTREAQQAVGERLTCCPPFLSSSRCATVWIDRETFSQPIDSLWQMMNLVLNLMGKTDHRKKQYRYSQKMAENKQTMSQKTGEKGFDYLRGTTYLSSGIVVGH
jgi:hypothetical protein